MSGFGYRLAITLWIGSLLTVGYLVAPSLFGILAGNRALAGEIAGVLFARGAWLGIACAAYLLIFLALRQRAGLWKSPVFWIVCLMLALTLLGQFGVQPVLAHLKDQAKPLEVMKSVLADRFAAWHGISSVLYLVQTLCGLVLLGVQGRGLRPGSLFD
ncbi:MAG: DUF4149 domain-containing protein [Rhodocyclaceae bacterium]|nr:DUF4149 domain-containing protein [Rhodocyclaceae bacterium]